MPRRSFSVLLAFLLLGLLMILAFAWFNDQGAESSIERARIELAEHKPSKAVQILNRTQRSLGPRSATKLRLDLHILRAAAMADQDLRNYDKAVDDLDFVLAEFEDKDLDPNDPRGFPFAVDRRGIQRRRILYLLLGENDQAALAAARSLLEQDSDDQVVLDLAGRALQVRYRKMRQEILDKDLNLVLSERQRQRLEKALLPWLYGSSSSPSTARDSKTVVDVLNDALDPLAAEEILARCRALRVDIQTCADYFAKALQGPKAMPASLQGYAGILLRGGDLDGAAALCWLYLQRFHGLSAAVSARRCMEAHLLEGDPALALAAGRFWLERDKPIERIDTPDEAGEAVEHKPAERRSPTEWNYPHAYAFYALALYQSGRKAELARFAQSLEPLLEGGDLELRKTFHWARGLGYYLETNYGACEGHLAAWCSFPNVFFRPDFGIDPYRIAMRTRVDAAKASKNPTLVQKILKEWIQRRPESVEPRLALVKVLIQDLALYRLATRECEAILQLPTGGEHEDEVLILLLQAQDLRLAPKHMNSEALLADLIANKQPIHLDLPHPVLRYGIAFLAAHMDADAIFEANIRRFLEDYPNSSNGRYLLARHYQKQGNPERALYETNSILARNPDHRLAALLHRELLQETKAPTVQKLEFDRRFLARFSDRPEAAEIMGELLLRRQANDSALLVSSSSVGAHAIEGGLPWIRGRARIALKQYPEAIDDLLRVRKDSPHRREALLLALRTALDQALDADVQAITDQMLKEKRTPRTLFEAAKLCGGRGLPKAVLDLLEPIYLGTDKESIQARNGVFFTLRARALLAMGKATQGRDMLRRAVSFDDGDEAGVYLVMTALFSGRKEEAREIRKQLGTLKGRPLTLLVLEARMGRFDEARKRLRDAKLPGRYLEKVLRQALDSLEGRTKTAKDQRTGVEPLDSFARGHAERVLEALCFAGDMAFRSRSDEAQASLRAWVSDGKDAVVEDFLVRLMAAWRIEQRGSRIAARERFGALLLPSSQKAELQSFFVLTHREFLRLAGKDYTFLTNPELTAYWMGLVQQAGAENLLQLGITQLSLLGTGRIYISLHQLDRTLELIQAADALTKNDPPVLEMLAKAQEHTGRLDLAVLTRIKRYRLLNGMEKVRELQTLLALRVRIARLDKLEAPGYEEALQKLQDLTYDYLEAKTGPSHPPLGRATLLAVQESWTQNPELVARLLTQCFTPYTSGEIAPGLDPEGLEDLLRFLLEKRHKGTFSWLEEILLRDPSLVGLHILEAEQLDRQGKPEEAVATLEHLVDLLPSERTLRALALLRARTGVGTAKTNRDLLRRLEKEARDSSSVERALLRFRLGEPEACLEALGDLSEKSRALSPKDQVLIDLARLYARRVDDYADIRDRMEDDRTRRVFPLGPQLAAQLGYLVPQQAKSGR